MNCLPLLSVPRLLARMLYNLQLPGCLLDLIFLWGYRTYEIKFVFLLLMFYINLIIRPVKNSRRKEKKFSFTTEAFPEPALQLRKSPKKSCALWYCDIIRNTYMAFPVHSAELLNNFLSDERRKEHLVTIFIFLSPVPETALDWLRWKESFVIHNEPSQPQMNVC